MTNKVTYVINCAGKQVKNLWESIGINYLTFNWQESDNEILFDKENKNISKAYEFIELSRKKGESCLIHSEKGQSRCSCLVTAYLMKHFKWSLYKTLEFLNSRRPDLEIRTAFFK
jgi:protein-tyrosine phosphatase